MSNESTLLESELKAENEILQSQIDYFKEKLEKIKELIEQGE